MDVIINNANILSDVNFRSITDKDWDLIMDVNLHGVMRVTRACWPHFRKQKYGKVIISASKSGLMGQCGHSHYAAAKMALVGFTETIAKEGAKYNIHCNVLVPAGASRTEWAVPLVAVLVHSSFHESGSVFEAAAGRYSKIRWERSKGLLVRPDQSLTAAMLLKKYEKIVDWANADHPTRTADIMRLLKIAMVTPPACQPNESLSFYGRVVLVTGGGDGLGRAYALHLGQLGARVAVIDLKNADRVASEIRTLGGEATALETSVENAEIIVHRVVTKQTVTNKCNCLFDRLAALCLFV